MKKPDVDNDYAPYRPYTHQVISPRGDSFSIHKSEAEAQTIADLYKGATVEPFTPTPSEYWTGSIGDRYDH